MFVTGSDYLHVVEGILNSINADVVYLAVAFWGKGSEQLFDGLPKRSKVRVICNLTSGGTNPKTIRALQSLGSQVSVRQLNDLHAKVVCGDKLSVIGSANCSSNGLALQGTQCSGWREAGVVTKEAEVLASIRTWLAMLWNEAEDINEADLALAQDNWDRRRALVNKEDAGRFIFDELHGKDYWEGKRVYLAISRDKASNQAVQEYERIKQREDRRAAAENVEESVLSFFEQWSELPVDGVLVQVQYRPRKKIAEVEAECYRRIPALDVEEFLTEKNVKSSLQIVQVETRLGEFPFGEREVKAIEKRLNENVDGMTRIQRLWNNKGRDEGAVIVPFSELFD